MRSPGNSALLTNNYMKKLVAKNPVTGLYFNGRNFDGTVEEAMTLRPGTTAETFRFSWDCGVVVEEVEDGSAAIAEKARKGMIARTLLEKRGWHISKERRVNNRQFIVRHFNTTHANKGWAIYESKSFYKNGSAHSIFTIKHPELGEFKPEAGKLEGAKSEVYRRAMKLAGF